VVLCDFSVTSLWFSVSLSLWTLTSCKRCCLFPFSLDPSPEPDDGCLAHHCFIEGGG
jgi:hypothetical protein